MRGCGNITRPLVRDRRTGDLRADSAAAHVSFCDLGGLAMVTPCFEDTFAVRDIAQGNGR